MAPQNSTLIHGNAAATSAVSADEELSSYSPILPARASHRRHATAISAPPPPPPPKGSKSIGTGKPEAKTSAASRGKSGIREGIEKGAVKRETNNPITYYRDFANNTDEEEDAATTDRGSANFDDDEIEIPIWIRGEPRFVAGINDLTTCSNIIQALIEDELQNGSYRNANDVAVSRDVNDYVITERWREVEQVLSGDTRILSIWNAWGDAKNEVQFRLKINKANLENAKSSKEHKSKKQKEKIGLINRMMRKVLKQGEAIQNHLSMISQKSAEKRNQDKFRKYVKKNYGKSVIMENFLEDATTLYDISVPNEEPDENCKCRDNIRRGTFPSNLFSTKKGKENKPQKTKLYESSDQLEALKNEDELLLVIEHTSDSDSGIFTNNQLGRKNSMPKKPSFGSMVEIDKLAKEPTEELLLDSTPKRKYRSKRRSDSWKNRNANRRKLEYDSDDVTPPIDDFENVNLELRKGTFNRTSFRFDLIRQEISTKMHEMQLLLEQEDDLLRRLKLKSAKFQAENQIYRSHIGLDFHVERLQESIDNCAKEIIEIEQELLRTKAEIEEKSPLIDNLKSMLEVQEAEQFRGYYSSYSPSGSTADSLDSSAGMGAMALPDCGSTETSSKTSLSSTRNHRETEFVDNIYEFCDNNQSFVV
ncbi:ras association domain-containing protein 10 [Wyeomyia smithii]|uniref:ras association domain-containing protein 10 n=1 Tax=Wyeomyia smithii TaxID=174621 RepID=UPI002467F537|nr:ras association domain-containing protein 10 [Wyeomyia smithii]XP_055534346.1 ras association domain-containing protein 10 [Wyeomyia smithii]